jgi:hypothetical protein
MKHEWEWLFFFGTLKIERAGLYEEIVTPTPPPFLHHLFWSWSCSRTRSINRRSNRKGWHGTSTCFHGRIQRGSGRVVVHPMILSLDPYIIAATIHIREIYLQFLLFLVRSFPSTHPVLSLCCCRLAATSLSHLPARIHVTAMPLAYPLQRSCKMAFRRNRFAHTLVLINSRLPLGSYW